MTTTAMRSLLSGSFWMSALFSGLLVMLFAGNPQAASSPWAANEQGRVRLITGVDSVGDTGDFAAGLHFEMQPGWKIYWRSPGDAGYPPQVDWSGSNNVAAVEMAWPLPHRFELFGLQTFGYGDEVIFPLTVTLQNPGQATQLVGSVDYLTCSEICVPQSAVLDLTLPSGDGGEVLDNLLIKQYESQVPGSESDGLTLETLALAGTLNAPIIEATLRSDQPLERPDLLVEGPPGFFYGKPEVTLSDADRQALIKVTVGKGSLAEGVLDGKRLTLTVMDGDRGLERSWLARFGAGTEVSGVLAAPTTEFASFGLWTILGMALLGGLILNVMPCVLPVLSIKLLSVAKQSGRETRAVRMGFLASSAGIVTSFLLLAFLAIGLKQAGLAVGWGIQFQQPIFLAVMAFLLTLFACNLFGFFEIPLPSSMGKVAAGARHEGVVGHFMTGAFATLLATPCSAPFLGTAVGFALARGPAEILLIFAALGVGLALPYLLVAALPRLATRLPKPGPWMITLRRLLGFALAGTALWLLSVMAAQIDLYAAAIVGILLLLIGFVIWRSRAGRLRRGLALPSVAALALLVVMVSAMMPRPGGREAVAADDLWGDFKQVEIAELVADKKVVFVDVTADWCITCQVNKTLVLGRSPVLDALRAEGVVALQADWTNPDEKIAAFLESFGRYGIPFNVVYGPAAPQGIPLPELLTDDAVLEGLRQARGG
ncbi:protein-disulfide reductase DsbD family protein [Limibacillus halophilus]|nr:protein-disulfide reductase DsbD domain-containing protein [Limibacillus halophilus]